MSKTYNLKVNTRNRSGSGALKAMRREGLVPAVIYGSNEANLNLKIAAKNFSELLHGAASEQILVNLNIEEEGTTKLALIQDVQHDALSGKILHVDFRAVRENEKFRASVPLELIGEPIGVREGGVLENQIHAVEVECFPRDLPEYIEGNISEIELGDAIHVSDLAFPEGVIPVTESDVVVALVTLPRLAADDEEEVAEGLSDEVGGVEGDGTEAPAES